MSGVRHAASHAGTRGAPAAACLGSARSRSVCCNAQRPCPCERERAAAARCAQMRAAVRATARLFPTAIISGRGREKVESFVQLKELYYAGSHGMDIVGPRVRPRRRRAPPVPLPRRAAGCGAGSRRAPGAAAPVQWTRARAAARFCGVAFSLQQQSAAGRACAGRGVCGAEAVRSVRLGSAARARAARTPARRWRSSRPRASGPSWTRCTRS